MNNIAFTSRIKAGTTRDFLQISTRAGIKNFVDYPWTLNQTVKAPIAYTKGVLDCSVLGITDGQDVLLLHLNPQNYSIPEKIKEFINKNIDITKSDLQAIVIGGKESRFSKILSENIIQIIKKWEIPLTELRINKSKNPINVAYNAQNDEWLINNDEINSHIKNDANNDLEIFQKIFKKIYIADCDEIL